MPSPKTDQALKNAWANQLLREHQTVCRTYNIGLARPLFEITDTRSIWGAWEPAARTIRISSRLIAGRSWDVTLAVLKHEMAHQIVTEILGGGHTHDALFRQACDMISVPEGFRSAGGDLPSSAPVGPENRVLDQNRAMIERAKKLLALAGSTNEHEASLAMAKAGALIEKYNLGRLEGEDGARHIGRIIELGRKRLENYHKWICALLMDFFFVETVLGWQYDPIGNDEFRIIDLMGTPENVLMAEYVFHFLINSLDRLWADHRGRTGAPGNRRRSYQLGVLEGFRHKLITQEKARQEEAPSSLAPRSPGMTTSLAVLSADQALAAFIRSRYPRLTTRRSPAARVVMETYNAGREDGKSLNLHRGVTEAQGYSERLLPE